MLKDGATAGASALHEGMKAGTGAIVRGVTNVGDMTIAGMSNFGQASHNPSAKAFTCMVVLDPNTFLHHDSPGRDPDSRIASLVLNLNFHRQTFDALTPEASPSIAPSEPPDETGKLHTAQCCQPLMAIIARCFHRALNPNPNYAWLSPTPLPETAMFVDNAASAMSDSGSGRGSGERLRAASYWFILCALAFVRLYCTPCTCI